MHVICIKRSREAKDRESSQGRQIHDEWNDSTKNFKEDVKDLFGIHGCHIRIRKSQPIFTLYILRTGIPYSKLPWCTGTASSPHKIYKVKMDKLYIRLQSNYTDLDRISFLFFRRKNLLKTFIKQTIFFL